MSLDKMNNYIVRSYREVIVITKFATRTASEAGSITQCILGFDFGPQSLKYSFTLHAQFGVGKPVILIDSCMVKSWFTFANLESVSRKQPKPKNTILYCIFE